VPSHELVEICGKALYQVELSRNNLEQMWGFSVEAELVENTERQDELCVFVSRVEDRSVAMNHGMCSVCIVVTTLIVLRRPFLSFLGVSF
jgi:T-lymphoma invasion and metastasis-inducing protein 1